LTLYDLGGTKQTLHGFPSPSSQQQLGFAACRGRSAYRLNCGNQGH
jgi:hypothetical protein